MKYKSEILLKISFLTGLIPFVGGWGIFLTWMLGRYLNASDFQDLEGLGFIWMFLCFFIAIGGLMLLSVYTFINRKNLNRKMLFTLGMILINIPSVYVVLEWQEYVDDMQFIKITNQTREDRLKVEIISDTQLIETTSLNNSKSSVLSYCHYDDLMGHRHYRVDRNLKLVIKGPDINKAIPYSELGYGACKQLIINEDFNVNQK